MNKIEIDHIPSIAEMGTLGVNDFYFYEHVLYVRACKMNKNGDSIEFEYNCPYCPKKYQYTHCHRTNKGNTDRFEHRIPHCLGPNPNFYSYDWVNVEHSVNVALIFDK